MGRRRNVSIGVLSLFGFLSAATAGTYDHSGFSFLTSGTSNYSPLSSYYVDQQPAQHASYQTPAASPVSTQPVVRKNRGLGHSHSTTYFTSPTIYLNKAPLYYPESTVFSDPLPIVPLPQLPSEFLTLNAANFANTGAYTGSQNEVPKKSKKGKGGKNVSTTPAPVEEDEDEDDAQETEADSAQGGYESSMGQREQARPRSRQREQGATGGYSGSDANAGSNTGGSSAQSEGATGGYPLSSGANGESPKATSGSRKRFRSRTRGNANQEDEEVTVGETDGEENNEFMMTGDDAEDNAAEQETDDDARDEEDEQEEVAAMVMRGRSKNSGKRGGKKSGRGKGRSEDEEAELNAALLQEGQKLGTIYVPTFGNNVLNTVFPAYSHNALLKSLEGQVGLLEQSYPESGQDVSGISIASDGKKSRKSKKKTSSRKNRPASRGRSSSRRSKNRPASNSQPNQGGYTNPPQQGQGSQGQSQQFSPASQPSQGNQGQSQQYGPPPQQSQGGSGGNQQYGPPPQQSQGGSGGSQQYGPPPQQSQGGSGGSQQYGPPPQQSQGNQQYGPPQFTPGNPSSQYGAPSSQQGINPPPQSGSGYQTIGNEFRGRTNDFPQQRSTQPILEPRQLSQVVSGANDQFPVAESNNPVTADLLRTVQAILQRYPN